MSVRFSPEPGVLSWSSYQKVRRSPPGQPWDAHTKPDYGLNVPRNTGIVRDGSDFKLATFEVTVSLNRSGTWVVIGHESAGLMDHERPHWMMDILVGREMHAALEALRAPTAVRLSELATVEFDWHRNVREDWLSKKYDDDTDHGSNAREQARWATQIQGWYTAGRITLATPR